MDAVEPATTRKRRAATLPERIKVNDLLREHLEKVGEKLFRYKNDHTDKSIAGLVASDLSIHTVIGVRMEMFGALVDDKLILPQPTDPTLQRAIERLCEYVNFERKRKGLAEIDFMASEPNWENGAMKNNG